MTPPCGYPPIGRRRRKFQPTTELAPMVVSGESVLCRTGIGGGGLVFSQLLRAGKNPLRLIRLRVGQDALMEGLPDAFTLIRLKEDSNFAAFELNMIKLHLRVRGSQRDPQRGA